MSPSAPETALATLEVYYDTAPRPLAHAEEIGPFTLFARSDPQSWHYYARPRLGLTCAIEVSDVDRVRGRQRELGVPEAIEWVHQTTPTALQSVRSSGLAVLEAPLLVLPPQASGAPGGAPGARDFADHASRHDADDERPAPEIRMLQADDPDLGAVICAVDAGFQGTDEVAVPDTRNQPELISAGLLRVVGAFVDGVAVGGGSHGPRDATTELTGIAVIPRARRRGIAAAITAVLVADARARGIRTIFLSAEDDATARIYEGVGFRRVGTACIAENE